MPHPGSASAAASTAASICRSPALVSARGAVVAPVPGLSMYESPVVTGALHEAPANVAQTIYDVGPTRVGFLSCAPGSFVVAERAHAEMFFVVDGVFFLTNRDGTDDCCS